MRRFVGVIRFDSPTWVEFQKIIIALTETGLQLSVEKEPNSDNLFPEYARWQIIIFSQEEEPK